MSSDFTHLRQVEIRGHSLDEPSAAQSWIWRIRASAPYFSYQKKQEDKVHPIQTVALEHASEVSGDDGLSWRKPALLSVHVIAGQRAGDYGYSGDGYPDDVFWLRLDAGKGPAREVEIKADKKAAFFIEGEPGARKPGFAHVVAAPVFPPGVEKPWPVDPSASASGIRVPPLSLVQGAIPLLIQPDGWFKKNNTWKLIPSGAPLPGETAARVRLLLVRDGIELQAEVPFPGTGEKLAGHFLLGRDASSGLTLRLLPERLDPVAQEAWRSRWNALARAGGAEDLIGFKADLHIDAIPAFCWQVLLDGQRIAGLDPSVRFPATEATVRLFGPRDGTTPEGEVTVRPKCWVLSPPKTAGALAASELSRHSDELWKERVHWDDPDKEIAKWGAGCILSAVVFPPSSGTGRPPVAPGTSLRLTSGAGPDPALQVELRGASSNPGLPRHLLAHDEERLAAALRAVQGLPEPPTSRGDPERPMLFGFVPLDDGWLQVPVPNLPPLEPSLDSDLLASPATAPPDVLHGFLRFGESPQTPSVVSAFPQPTDFQLERAPWVATIESTQALAVAIMLPSGGQPRRALAILMGPELSTRGLLWFSADRPDAVEALPRLGAGAGVCLDLPLESFDVEKRPILPVELGTFAFEVKRAGVRTESVTRTKLQLGLGFAAGEKKWKRYFEAGNEPGQAQWRDRWVRILQDSLEIMTPGAGLTFAAEGKLPLVLWRRHPQMPLAAGMPMTRSVSSAVRPLESRDLVPWVVSPLDWPAQPLVLQWNGAAVFPRVGQGSAAQPPKVRAAWSWPWPGSARLRDQTGIALTAFGVPGAELTLPSETATGFGPDWQGMRAALRFDLPVLDEAFATATLPPAAEVKSEGADAPPPSAPAATALDWRSLGALWEFQERRHRLARVMHSQVRPFFALDAEHAVDVADLVGGAKWPAQVGFFKPTAAAALPYGLARTESQSDQPLAPTTRVNGDGALLGFSSANVMLRWDDPDLEGIAEFETRVVGFAPSSIPDGKFLIDARGTGLGEMDGDKQSGWRRPVRVRHAQDSASAGAWVDFELVTRARPVEVAFTDSGAAAFNFWFKDLPVRGAGMIPAQERIDPAVWLDGQLPRAGCEWRFWPADPNLARQIFERGRDRFPFFGFALEPLHLESCTFELNGEIKGLEILCRLHLGPRTSDPEGGGNLVVLALKGVDGRLVVSDLSKRSQDLRFSLNPEYAGNATDGRATELALKAIGWDGHKGEPIFPELEMVVRLFGGRRSLVGKPPPPEEVAETAGPSLALCLPAQADGAITVKFTGPAIPKDERIAAGTGEIRLRSVELTCRTETVESHSPPATLRCLLRVALLPMLAQGEGSLESELDWGVDEESADQMAPPAFLAESELVGAKAEVLSQSLPLADSHFEEGENSLAVTLETTPEFTPLLGLEGRAALGFLAHVGAIDPATGRGSLGAGCLSATWAASSDPGSNLQLEAHCARRPDRATAPVDPTPIWTGHIRATLRLAVRNEFRWPELDAGGTETTIPWPGHEPDGRTKVAFNQAKPGWVHSVTYQLDGHRLPFSTVSLIAHGEDQAYATPVMAVHELREFQTGAFDANSPALLRFTSVENIVLGRAGGVVPRAATPPLGGPNGVKTFESDKVTFAGRYRSQRPPGSGAAPGMVKLGVGRLSTVFAGCLGNAFRARFWAQLGDSNPLVVAGGFLGFPIWSETNVLPAEHSAHLLRMPVLGFLQSQYPAGWNPAYGQGEAAPFEVAWAGGGAARQLALSFRSVATPASGSLESLRGTLLAGAALPGAADAGRPEAIESALLVEQNLRVSMDDPQPRDLAQWIFHPAAALSISRLAVSAAQNASKALHAISLVAGRLRRGRRSLRFAASLRAGTTRLAPAGRSLGSSIVVLGDDLTVGPWDAKVASATVSVSVIAGRAGAEHPRPRHALIIDQSGGQTHFQAIGLPSQRRITAGAKPTVAAQDLGFPDSFRGYSLDPGEPASWMRGFEEGPTEPFRDFDPAEATSSGLSGLSRRVDLGAQTSPAPIWLAEIRAPIYQPAENLAGLVAPAINWLAPGQSRPRLPTAGAVAAALQEVVPVDDQGASPRQQWIVPAGGTFASVGDRAGIAVARIGRLETACLPPDPANPPNFDWNYSRFGQPGQGGAWTFRTERTPRPGPLPPNRGEPAYPYLRRFPLPGMNLRSLGDPARDRRPRASSLEPQRSTDLVIGPAEILSGDGEPSGEFGPWVVKLAAAADWRGLFSDRTDGTLTLDAEITLVAGRLTLGENPGLLLRRLLLPGSGPLQSTAALVVGGKVFPFLRVHFVSDTGFAPVYPVQPLIGPPPPSGKLPPECVIRSCVRLVLDARADTTGAKPGFPAEALGAALRAGWSAPHTELQLTVYPDSRRAAITADAPSLDFSTGSTSAAGPLPSGDSGPPVTLRLPLVPVVSSRGALPLPPLTLLFGDPAYDAELGTAPAASTVRLVNPQATGLPLPLAPGRGDLLFGLSADRARVNYRSSVVFMVDLRFERPARTFLNPVPAGTSLDGDLLRPAGQLSLRLRLAIVDRNGVRREVFFASEAGRIDPDISVSLAQVYELALSQLREADGSPCALRPGEMLELAVEERAATPLQPSLWNAESGQRIDLVSLDKGRGITCSLRILLTAEPVVEPPPALYAALVGRAENATLMATRCERLSLPLYAQSPLPWRVTLANAKDDFRAGFMRRNATFVWTLARPHDEWDRLGVALVKADRNGQTHLPATLAELERPRLLMTNPCPHSAPWPSAPAPTSPPLAAMQWATGQSKDKFGCTRDGGTKFHAGIDLRAPEGTDCFATEAAKVEEVGYGAEVGKYVSISFKKGGQTIGVAYCHLSKTSVTKGAQVAAGQKLGETGVTGNAEPANPHLHLEVQNQVWVAYADAESRSLHGMNPNGYV